MAADFLCACEHRDHFGPELDSEFRFVGTPKGHVYLAPAKVILYSAKWVGQVCEECAATHMADYLI